MTLFHVRAAKPSDWPMFHPFLDKDRPLDSLEAAFVRFQNRLESPLHGVFVAEQAGQIVGVAMAHEWDHYIMSGRKQIRFSVLVVQEEQRKKGIGKALFETARDWAKGIGATWFEWYASTSGIGFYEHLGYVGDSNPDPETPFFEIEFANT
jgi:GNAT superfamily N-acetyltransferase